MTVPDAELIATVQAVLAAPRPWSVTQVGEPVLRQRASRYDGQLPECLLHELLDAMRQHLPGVGVGLAAPQIGISLAVAVIEDPAEVSAEIADARGRRRQPLLELINPVIRPLGNEVCAFYEGCLSIAGLTAVVARPASIELSATDRHGHPYITELSGWPARIAQHETDHLAGVLYLDRADPRSLSTVQAHERLWSEPTPVTAAVALGFTL